MKTGTLIGIGIGTIALAVWLAEQRKKEPSINYVNILPFGKNLHAICLPPIGIFIKRENMGNEFLLKHELIHWNQYQQAGLLPFYWNYLSDYLRVGYDKHPMEMEAREFAGESPYCIVNYTHCVRNGMAQTAFNPNFFK